MNSKRKIAVISLVAMMLITAVGYAAYSDTLSVTGEASTAAFDVQFLGVAQPNPDNVTLSYGHQTVTGGTNVWDTVNIKATNLVPGEIYSIKIQFKNCGTIPAVMDVDACSYSLFDDACIKVESMPTDDELSAPLLPGAVKDYTITIRVSDAYASCTEGMVSAKETGTATFVFKQQ